MSYCHEACARRKVENAARPKAHVAQALVFPGNRFGHRRRTRILLETVVGSRCKTRVFLGNRPPLNRKLSISQFFIRLDGFRKTHGFTTASQNGFQQNAGSAKVSKTVSGENKRLGDMRFRSRGVFYLSASARFVAVRHFIWWSAQRAPSRAHTARGFVLAAPERSEPTAFRATCARVCR